MATDTMTEYSYKTQTYSAEGTAKARELSGTAEGHAGVVKSRPLETSRQGTVRTGKALGRGDLPEYAAGAGLLTLIILIAWWYCRIHRGPAMARPKQSAEASLDVIAHKDTSDRQAETGITRDVIASAAPGKDSVADARAKRIEDTLLGPSYESLSGSANGEEDVLRGKTGGGQERVSSLGPCLLPKATPAASGDAEMDDNAKGDQYNSNGINDHVPSDVGDREMGSDVIVVPRAISFSSDAATAGTDIDVEARSATIEELAGKDDPGSEPESISATGSSVDVVAALTRVNAQGLVMDDDIARDLEADLGQRLEVEKENGSSRVVDCRDGGAPGACSSLARVGRCWDIHLRNGQRSNAAGKADSPANLITATDETLITEAAKVDVIVNGNYHSTEESTTAVAVAGAIVKASEGIKATDAGASSPPSSVAAPVKSSRAISQPEDTSPAPTLAVMNPIIDAVSSLGDPEHTVKEEEELGDHSCTATRPMQKEVEGDIEKMTVIADNDVEDHSGGCEITASERGEDSNKREEMGSGVVGGASQGTEEIDAAIKDATRNIGQTHAEPTGRPTGGPPASVTEKVIVETTESRTAGEDKMPTSSDDSAPTVQREKAPADASAKVTSALVTTVASAMSSLTTPEPECSTHAPEGMRSALLELNGASAEMSAINTTIAAAGGGQLHDASPSSSAKVVEDVAVELYDEDKHLPASAGNAAGDGSSEAGTEAPHTIQSGECPGTPPTLLGSVMSSRREDGMLTEHSSPSKGETESSPLSGTQPKRSLPFFKWKKSSDETSPVRMEGGQKEPSPAKVAMKKLMRLKSFRSKKHASK